MKIELNQQLQHLGFASALPSAVLQPYVLGYWMIRKQMHLTDVKHEYMHPDGGMGLVFNFADVLSFNNSVIEENCFMDGTHTTSSLMGFSGNIFAIGIRFLPGGAYPFFSSALHEINNLNINLEELHLEKTEILYQQLYFAKTMTEIVSLLEQWLISKLQSSLLTSNYVTESVKHIILSKGNLNIKDLAAQVNISQRQLERLFKIQVGMTAKKMSRIIQIRFARKYLKQLKPKQFKSELQANKIKSSAVNSSGNLRYLDGFYDQAHFIKEFRTIIGKTPGAYLNRKRNNIPL